MYDLTASAILLFSVKLKQVSGWLELRICSIRSSWSKFWLTGIAHMQYTVKSKQVFGWLRLRLY